MCIRDSSCVIPRIKVIEVLFTFVCPVNYITDYGLYSACGDCFIVYRANEKMCIRDRVEYQAQEFVNDMLGALRERQLDLRTGRVIFVGGGACLLRRQIEASGKVAHPVFVEDVNANAKGFEYLYRCTVTGA